MSDITNDRVDMLFANFDRLCVRIDRLCDKVDKLADGVDTLSAAVGGLGDALTTPQDDAGDVEFDFSGNPVME